MQYVQAVSRSRSIAREYLYELLLGALTVAAVGIGTTLTTVGPANGASARGFERTAASNGDIARSALAAVKEHRSAVHGGTAQAFTVQGVLVDSDGGRHVRMTRTFHGLPVVGGLVYLAVLRKKQVRLNETQ